MVSEAWKNFVNETLTEFEGSNLNSSEGAPESLERDENLELDPLKEDKKSWCSTLDRSFGYAFKSFCRFVVTSTLAECSVKKVYKIGPKDVEDVINRNFFYRERRPHFSLPRYFESYPRYAKWHNSWMKKRRLNRTRRGCNLSYFRKLSCERRRAPEPKQVVDRVRYKMVKPVNAYVKRPLSAVFE